MQKIKPCIWCSNNNAEEMMHFYQSVFKHSKVLSISRWGEGGHGPAGSVLVGFLELEGLQIMLLNGGPQFQHSESFSLFIGCDSQEEIDYYWERLTADGGQGGPCGWLKDKFGFSWQVGPAHAGDLLSSGQPAQRKAYLQLMDTMDKLDMNALNDAYDNAL